MPCSIMAAAVVVVDVVGQLDEPVGGDQPLVGIAAEHAGIRDAVADLEFGDARTDGFDRAGALHADHRRQARELVEPGAVIDVDVVETDGTLAQAHLARARLADLDLLPLQHLGPAVGVDADCVRHGRPFPRAAARARFALTRAMLAFYGL